MEKFRVKIVGTVPLLQHRFPDEEHGENKSKAKKKNFTAKEECDKSLYKDDKGNIYQPSEHIFRTLIKAATSFKYEGKKTFKDIVTIGVAITPDNIPHIYPKWEVDARNVVVQRNRIMRYRPCFPKWALEFEIEILDENLNRQTLQEILEKAGKIGLGDYRPRFGRFNIEFFKQIEFNN